MARERKEKRERKKDAERREEAGKIATDST